MTPTLLGRWQTRLLLLATVGVLLTCPFAFGLVAPAGTIYWVVLGWVAGVGWGWDVLYAFLQSFRWDRDWPALYQLLAGIWEGFFIFVPLRLTLNYFQINWLDGLRLDIFLWHYGLVWLGVFVASQTLMRIIFPRWRFRGGQWL